MVRALTGREAILGTFGFIGGHELTAAQGQLISHVFDEWMARHPVVTVVATFAFANITAAHLCNILHQPRLHRLDPYAGFGYAVLSWIKGRPA